MGQCIYVSGGYQDGEPIEVREMPSETWMNPAEAGRVLGEKHLLNTTIGVWFYESHLWDKRELRRRLRALVDHVTAPSFLREYEEWGKQYKKPRRATARRASRRSSPRR